MDFDLRWPLLLVANLILLSLLRLVNDPLGAHGMTLFLPALFLLEPSIRFRLRWAFLLVGVTGLLYDAYAPISYGTSLILFTIVTAIFFINRIGIRRASVWQHLWILLAANSFLWLAFTLCQGWQWLGNTQYWIRSLSDLLISSLILFPVGYWFIYFQRMLTRFVGREFDQEAEA